MLALGHAGVLWIGVNLIDVFIMDKQKKLMLISSYIEII